MKRETVKSLIEEGLGFCCMWAFFTKYKRTSLIATRLGVSDRAVRKAKALFRADCLSCEKKLSCLKARVLRR